jgi:hypothetical protein
MTAILLGYKDLGRKAFLESKDLNWKIPLPPPNPSAQTNYSQRKQHQIPRQGNPSLTEDYFSCCFSYKRLQK